MTASQQLIGWVLVLLGFLYILVGLWDSIRKLARGPEGIGVAGFSDLLLELVKQGLGAAVVGIILVYLGLRVLDVGDLPALLS